MNIVSWNLIPNWNEVVYLIIEPNEFCVCVCAPHHEMWLACDCCSDEMIETKAEIVMRISEKEHSTSRGQQKNIAAKSKYESLQETTQFLLFFCRSVAEHIERESDREVERKRKRKRERDREATISI